MSVNNQRSLHNVRDWNSRFPPGTEVEYRGERRETWSWAGQGKKSIPCVFLVGAEEPVPLDVLIVPGWERFRR